MTVRLALGLLLILASAAIFLPFVGRWLRHERAVPALFWLFSLSRIAGCLAAYALIPGLVRSSDLVKYYLPEAQLALGGQLPYLDFPSSYGPLFPYLAGSLLLFWNSPAAIALAMVGCEIVAVGVLCSCVRRERAPEDRLTSQPALAQALFLYMVSPAALYWSGLTAYNSSVVLLFWVIALALLFRLRYGPSLVALSLSVLAGKALGLLAGPLWLADPRRRIGMLAAAAVLALGAFLVARHYEIDLLLPLTREGERSTSGNIWFLLSGLMPLTADSAVWKYGPLASFALAVGALTLWLASKWKQAPSIAQFSAAIAVIGWLFMLLSKKTYPHYTPMFLLFCVLALSTASPRGLWILMLAFLGAIGIIEPGLWNALRQPTLLSEACRFDCRLQDYYGLIGSDLVIVGIEAYLAYCCARIAGAARNSPG